MRSKINSSDEYEDGAAEDYNDYILLPLKLDSRARIQTTTEENLSLQRNCEDNLPCDNDGLCNRFGRCECKHGFVGKLCEHLDQCVHRKPCKHGTCQALEDGYYSCDCFEGYSGSICDVRDSDIHI